MFINRTYERTEHDDFLLNVQSQLSRFKAAVPVHDPVTGKLVGWRVQNRYE